MSPARPTIPVLKDEVSRMLSLAREHRRQARQLRARSCERAAMHLDRMAEELDQVVTHLMRAGLHAGDAEVQQRFADGRRR